MDKKEKKELCYYLTLFKIEGHKTWRLFIGNDSGSFDRMWTTNNEGKKPKITEKRIYRIDRFSGEIDVKTE